MRFDRNALGDLEAALTHEWLETNGLGGSASSTRAGLNTCPYHGFLVAARKPPVARYVLLVKREETSVRVIRFVKRAHGTGLHAGGG
jgi:hypothetical protein